VQWSIANRLRLDRLRGGDVKLSRYGPATRKRDLNRTSEEFEKWRTTRGFNESGAELVVL
jgi:hypothetical protein